MKNLYEEIEDEKEEYPFNEYELSSNPNDFNLLTLTSFVDSVVVKIPNFQRNYVWDLTRASKLIESLLIGLPVQHFFFTRRQRTLI